MPGDRNKRGPETPWDQAIMTRVDIEAGICGVYARVHAVKRGGRSVEITIESDCKQVIALGESLNHLDIQGLFHRPFNLNPVYEKAGRCHLHPGCPVPCAVIKAAEIELELALKKDVKLTFK